MIANEARGDARRIGRIVGALLLAQALLAIPVYTEFGMMRGAIASAYLTEAAPDATQIRAGILLTYVLSAITIAVALVAWPLFRRLSERMALLFLMLSVSGFATHTVEAIAIADMLSLSIRYTTDGASEVLEALARVTRSSWRTAHFTNLALGHVKAFVLFLLLFRFALVPRLLAGLGIAATIVSTTAAVLPLLAFSFSYVAVAPTALVQLTLCVWLLVKGFREPS